MCRRQAGQPVPPAAALPRLTQSYLIELYALSFHSACSLRMDRIVPERDRILTTDDLVSSEDVFFAATGITDGELMAGVRYKPGGATTDSLVMRSRSGTIRSIRSEHALWKLSAYSSIKYD